MRNETDTLHVYIVGDSETILWGLRCRDRLLRMLRNIPDIVITEQADNLADETPVLLLRGDCLFHPRLLRKLCAMRETLAVADRGQSFFAAILTPAASIADMHARILARPDPVAVGNIPIKTPDDLVPPYDQKLKKNEPVYVYRVVVENTSVLEDELFAGSYKGVTDLITKWLWPYPAKWATRFCVAKGITPNQVTWLSVLLAVFAAVAFYLGFFGVGLLSGWIMTFLDTLDGKLARVTVSASRFGDILDHGLDIIHPPVWYYAWGIGAAMTESAMMTPGLLIGLILTGYLGGRFCEGFFQHVIAPYTIFMWRPLDSITRLVSARRNPNLIILTVCYAYAQPVAGLWLVIIWHFVSTTFLLGRVVLAYKDKQQQGNLPSWLESVDPVTDRRRLVVRMFTRVPGCLDTGDSGR